MYKIVYIVYDSVLEKRLLEFMNGEKIEAYYEVPEMKCEWNKGYRHLNTHAWPGTDSMMMIILAEEKAREFVKELKTFKKELDLNVPIIGLIVPVEEIF